MPTPAWKPVRGRDVRSRLIARSLLLALVGPLGACGIQLSSAWHGHAENLDSSFSLTVGARLVQPRGGGALVGGDVTLSDPAPSARFSFANASLVAGYRWMWPGAALELAPELGIGRPAFEDQKGAGLWLGGQLVGLFRIYGDQDQQVGFAPAAFYVDAVLGARCGVHAAFEPQHVPFWDAAVFAGIRVTAFSDLAYTRSDRWER